MESDYTKDLEIDLAELHTEWLRQPVLYMEYAEMAAEASRARDKAKNALDVVKAQLDLEIRSDPAKFELAKITETAVANVIMIRTEYQESLDRYHQAKYDLDILNAAVRAFDQRKAALENEVRLLAGQYFAGPKEPYDITKDFGKEALRAASDEQRQLLNQGKEDRK